MIDNPIILIFVALVALTAGLALWKIAKTDVPPPENW